MNSSKPALTRVISKPERPLVAHYCDASYHILSSYYCYSEKPHFDSFLLPACADLGNAGRVLLEHDTTTNELFLGLQFGLGLEENLPAMTGHKNQNSLQISGHLLAVIAEETSHLQALCDAARLEVGISRLDLEVLGEIDRFLTLMHWNGLVGRAMPWAALKKHTDLHFPPLPNVWRNLHDLCDFMFSGQRFGENTDPLYFDVEALALQHLKKAFVKEWDCTRTDFTRVSIGAQIYLQSMRASFFRPLEARDSEESLEAFGHQHKSLPESA